jgi:uncharacterized protein (DUF433 family)
MSSDLKTTSSWVQKTPGVCGGRACVRNTRITVWGLVNSRRLGAPDEQLLENVVGLTPDDLRAAWRTSWSVSPVRILRQNPKERPDGSGRN